MIFVDTSALIAILAEEPDASMFAAKIEAEADCISGAHVILESSMRFATIAGLRRRWPTDRLHRVPGGAIDVVPMTEDVAHVAVAAFERYGKGRKSRAGLNFGDCLSYACAKVHGARLLFKGDNFAHTDIAKA